jgi:hypothetical protein
MFKHQRYLGLWVLTFNGRIVEEREVIIRVYQKNLRAHSNGEQRRESN